MSKPVQCHFGDKDDIAGFSDLAAATELEALLQQSGCPREFSRYPTQVRLPTVESLSSARGRAHSDCSFHSPAFHLQRLGIHSLLRSRPGPQCYHSKTLNRLCSHVLLSVCAGPWLHEWHRLGQGDADQAREAVCRRSRDRKGNVPRPGVCWQVCKVR